MLCGKKAKELCNDLVCRKCHVSVSFEDCVDGTWSARMRIAAGVPREFVKKIYPEAKI